MATQKISEMTEAIILQDEDYVPIVQSELNKKIKIEYLRDYNKLHNKPTLNGITIENNKLLKDYNITKENQGIQINGDTFQTLELEVPTNQELEQRADVNKAITIATADKMAKETAHQTMSKEYQPNSQDKLKEGEKQPVSYKAVKEYVDTLESKVNENEIDIENKHLALETKVDENEQDIENKVQNLDTKTAQKDAELEELINTNEQDIEQKVSDLDQKTSAKDQELEELINTYVRNDEYTDEFLQKFFALQRTGKVYTVKFPLFSKSTSPIGEKIDYNEGLTCEPSTDTIIGQDDYQDIPLFKTYDVNAYADDNGRIHVTAFKGDKYFKDMGKVDVFVLGMSYYEKYWEDDNYWYYSRTDMPRDGYTLCAECRNTDGSESSYALYSKYVSGEIDGKPYSSKGLIPKRNMSYNACESYYHSRGKNYGGSPMYLYKYLMTTFYLKYATLNTQSKIYGCFNYSYQYAASMAENNVKRIVLTTAQAANIVVGSYVSIGDKGSNSSVDRGNSYMHNKAEEVEVISKTTVDDSHVAINVDSPTSFNTTTTTYLSTMHWKSGFSDKVLGRDGSIGDLTSGKYPMVLQGIELAVGGYEVAGNAFMDIVSSTGKRDIYVTNDNSKIVTNVTNAKATYNKSKNSSQPTTLSAWNYITKMALDEENGMFNVIECGNSGSGSATGFCDGFYVDSGTSGQREFLLLGNLWYTAVCGLSFVNANHSLSYAYWYFLARLSISGRKG